jgi:hypothetical protein
LFSNLLLVLLWLNFVYFWFRVYRETWAADYKESISFLSALMVGYAALVAIWIVHNVGIYKRKGSRKGLRVIAENHEEDALRNQIAFRTDPKATQSILIEVIEGQKIFTRRTAPGGTLIPPGS